MDDQLVQEILSQTSKPKKSVIYQRSVHKQQQKEEDDKPYQAQRPLKQDWQYGGLDKQSTRSKVTQMSKQTDNILNNWRRSRLQVKNQTGLTQNNLRKIESESHLQKDKAHLESTYQPDKERQLQEPKEENEEEEQAIKCTLCECAMTENDQKISQKIINYAKDQGDLKRMFKRIKTKLQEKAESGDLPPLKVEDREMGLEHLSQICFKCHYQMILGKEGRHRAIRMYDVAAQDQWKTPHYQNERQRDLYLCPQKVLTAHKTSQEMNELNLMKGSFFDYSSSPMEDYGTPFKQYQSALVAQNQKKKNNSSLIVSLAKEAPKFAQEQIEQQNSVKKVPRQWRTEFTDKIIQKYGNSFSETRQKKLAQKLEKERKKYFIGERIHESNMKILHDHKKESHAKQLKGNTALEERKRDLNTSVQSGISSNAINISEFGVSSQHEAFNMRPFEKVREIDKTFHRKISSFGAFANASFNGGVFFNPSQQNA